MNKRFSEMTNTELNIEMDKLLRELNDAPFPSQREILQARYDMAKAYTLEPQQFTPGVYRVRGCDELLHVTYINGIMAWGHLGEGQEAEEASFPISIIERIG